MNKKRISGTYFDYFVKYIPYGIAVSLLSYLLIPDLRNSTDIYTTVLIGVCTGVILGGAISLKILFTGKVNSSLYYEVKTDMLYFGEVLVEPRRIQEIRWFSTRTKADITYVEFKVSQDKSDLVYRIFSKPNFPFEDVFELTPKSLICRFKMCPELESVG